MTVQYTFSGQCTYQEPTEVQQLDELLPGLCGVDAYELTVVVIITTLLIPHILRALQGSVWKYISQQLHFYCLSLFPHKLEIEEYLTLATFLVRN